MRGKKDRLESELRKSLKKNGSLLVSDLNLSGIDLHQRALLGIEFRRCEFSGANFSRADLSLARFIDCSMYMVDFSESVLYTTWFYECNLTKARFNNAYLLGFRMRNVDITKAEFDGIPAIGLERKSRTQSLAMDLRLPLMGSLPRSAQEIEGISTGIGMDKFDRIVTFIDPDGNDDPRVRIRAAETAKYLRNVHAENGYDQKATHYYIVERRLRRQAMQGSFISWIRRVQDFVFGEMLWRYGSSLLRPILALAALAFAGVVTTYFAPMISPTTGLKPPGPGALYTFHGWNFQSFLNFMDVGYFYLTAPAGGSGAILTGWIKAGYVVYVLLALWLLALIFDAFSRNVGMRR